MRKSKSQQKMLKKKRSHQLKEKKLKFPELANLIDPSSLSNQRRKELLWISKKLTWSSSKT